MTTPAEKDAMALAVLRENADDIGRCATIFRESQMAAAFTLTAEQMEKASFEIAEARAHLAARIAELEEAASPKITEMHFQDGQFRIAFAVDFAKDLARCYSDLCDAHGAQNYLELRMEDAVGREFTVTVQKGERPSPAMLRNAAEERATRAEAELAAVREWLSKLESFVGPGALAYMRREFDAARGANK